MGEREKETPAGVKGPRDGAIVSTFAPARNFTIPLAARVRAAAGPPAYAVRKRRIEDLEDELLVAVRDMLATSRRSQGELPLEIVRRMFEADRSVSRRLRELTSLVAAHNRYYPVEANLPLDPKTGALLERGSAWKPLPAPCVEAFLARAVETTEG
jgi:hypothetical protein